MNSESRICQNCKQSFVIESEDFNFYEKIGVPPPTFCPSCRYQRRLANRNEWNFYKRKCNLCGKDIVTIYNPDYPSPVYCQPCWWSDKWDPLSYGREFDFSRPFFEQFQELRLQVPHIALMNVKSVNSEYTNQSLDNKNCYLCVSTSFCEDCYYGYWTQKSRQCVDCYNVVQSELLYESLNSLNCNKSAYLEDCSDCMSSYFLKDCRGCTSCFGCFGLRNKSYCWKNEQLTKEEYQERFSKFIFNHRNIEQEKNALHELEKEYPHKYYHGNKNTNSVGDYINETKNVFSVFNCTFAQNVRYSQDAWWSEDSLDVTEVFSELGYELEGADGKSVTAVTKSTDIFNVSYSELCFNGHDLFGCVSINKKNYCVFNRPYEKDEYTELVRKIIAHMRETGELGEFFPSKLSLFAYNETVAQDYFPLTEKDASAKGFRWYRRQDREYGNSVPRGELPETIADTTDDILKKTIKCLSQESEENRKKYLGCTTAFKITEGELALYRKMNMPIPQKCFNCRRQDRMALRNPRQLWHRACMCDKNKHSWHTGEKCKNEFETSYAPDRPEIVYCEQCYNAEIV